MLSTYMYRARPYVIPTNALKDIKQNIRLLIATSRCYVARPSQDGAKKQASKSAVDTLCNELLILNICH